jgi:hypothetical protein
LPRSFLALRAAAVFGIEWTTLAYIENSPVFVRIASFVIALCVLTVLEGRDWLKFRSPGIFSYIIAILIVIYVTVCSYAFYSVRDQPAYNPAFAPLQSQLASALRERDIAISQRDVARSERGEPSGPPIPAIPQSLSTEDVESRIDAWKGVDATMNDIIQILFDGDSIVSG